ncbi:hypothetical protein BGX34_010643 [Mortierella sp. NVP85]|nr:hypothetical protein BGX34_010643 [Mortierella sp. NVP85]
MAYPLYQSKDVPAPPLEGVPEFFNRNKVEDWTPENFAKDPDTYILQDFIDGLCIIKEAGKKQYHAFAGACYSWCMQNPEHTHIKVAETTLQGKVVESEMVGGSANAEAKRKRAHQKPTQYPKELPVTEEDTGSVTEDNEDTIAASEYDETTELRDLRTNISHFQVLNQETSWMVNGVDVLERFYIFRGHNLDEYSLARDQIADLRPDSKFKRSLPSHVAEAVSPSTPINIQQMWPTLEPIFERAFKAESYDDVSSAFFEESLKDPIVRYMSSIITSYEHYLKHRDEIPQDLNERDAFVHLTWSFIRGAMTVVGIESRSLEVLIVGVRERMNHGRDPISDTKEIGQFADGIALYGKDQLFLAEASCLFQPKVDKRWQDEFKLARAMRDSWVSQIKSTCHDAIPCRGMAVFGSCTYKDETRFWKMDFQGAFRLQEFDLFSIPTTKANFGTKMKRALSSSLRLVARLKQEIENRKNVVPAPYEDYVRMAEAVGKIEMTTEVPKRYRKKRCPSSSD